MGLKFNFLNVNNEFYSKKENKKCARQRKTKGYCYRDVWEIDTWFLHIMPRMIEDLKNHHWGWPTSLIFEYYDLHKDEIPLSKDDFVRHLYSRENKELYKKADEWEENRWNEILGKMVFLFDESTDENCSMKNEFEDLGYSNEKYCKRNLEIMRYKKKCKKEALKMFVKYFDNLWD